MSGRAVDRRKAGARPCVHAAPSDVDNEHPNSATSGEYEPPLIAVRRSQYDARAGNLARATYRTVSVRSPGDAVADALCSANACRRSWTRWRWSISAFRLERAAGVVLRCGITWSWTEPAFRSSIPGSSSVRSWPGPIAFVSAPASHPSALAVRTSWHGEMATLDRNSRVGRLVLGVGLGHPAEEYTTFGENGDLPDVLAARTDEALRVLTGLWSGEPFDHDGDSFHRRPWSDSCLPRYSAPARPCGSRACCHLVGHSYAWCDGNGVVPIRVGSHGIQFLTPDDIGRIVSEIRQRRGSLDGFDVVVNPGPPPAAPLSVASIRSRGRDLCITSMDEFPGWLDTLPETSLTQDHQTCERHGNSPSRTCPICRSGLRATGMRSVPRMWSRDDVMVAAETLAAYNKMIDAVQVTAVLHRLGVDADLDWVRSSLNAIADEQPPRLIKKWKVVGEPGELFFYFELPQSTDRRP